MVYFYYEYSFSIISLANALPEIDFTLQSWQDGIVNRPLAKVKDEIRKNKREIPVGVEALAAQL